MGDAMKRILFVDDEPHVLDGLRNLLRKQRNVWEMSFAVGGQAALEELRKAPFDVIVTDMRMPGMDGATLLQKVKEEHPRVARIVLSGHAEREVVVKALPLSHQYLSKPCDEATLRAVIERACELQSLLDNGAIRDVVGKMDRLPSVPRTYSELSRVMGERDAGLGDVAKIIEQDPAMCAKILQLVNSPYFGLSRRVTSASHAVNYLGIELLKGLVLTAEVFGAMDDSAAIEGFSMERLQEFSVLTAAVSKQLVSDPKDSEQACTAGLVHDIGKIILALAIPACFQEVVRVGRAGETPFHAIEKEMIGVTHAEVGGYLLGVWGLPLPIVEAVTYHHGPLHPGGTGLGILGAVHVADALVDGALAERDGRRPESRLDVPFLKEMGLIDELPKWRAIVDAETRAQMG